MRLHLAWTPIKFVLLNNLDLCLFFMPDPRLSRQQRQRSVCTSLLQQSQKSVCTSLLRALMLRTSSID